MKYAALSFVILTLLAFVVFIELEGWSSWWSAPAFIAAIMLAGALANAVTQELE